MNEGSSMDKVHLIDIRNVSNQLGFLGFVENVDLPFNVKRVYFISDVPKGVIRGQHGHRHLKQFLVALKGSFEIRVINLDGENIYKLNTKTQGLYIPSNSWRELKNFTQDAICLVLASDQYDENDYYYNLNDFIDLISTEAKSLK